MRPLERQVFLEFLHIIRFLGLRLGLGLGGLDACVVSQCLNESRHLILTLTLTLTLNLLTLTLTKRPNECPNERPNPGPNPHHSCSSN